MSQLPLPQMPDPVTPPPSAAPPTRPAVARIRRAVRNQVEWVERDLDSQLPEQHPARAIWGLLECMDLDAFYADSKATLDRPGQPASDPRVLLALWVYATVEGIGKARQLDRLCHEPDAYRWLRGGVPVNYHLLSDFRVAHPTEIDDLLTQIVGCLLAAEAVSLEQVAVAQDGMRVRASAGAASFRREARLEACLAEAKAQVERLKAEREHPEPGVSRRQQAARERAAQEREQRVARALALLPEAQAAKERQQRQQPEQQQGTGKPRKVTEPRVSTTDPQARVMKMADGGFRPAYNVEVATVQAPGKLHGVIVGVAVTNEGSDARQAVPMVAQVERRTGERPQRWLMDGGFAAREGITALEQQGITVYAPVPATRTKPEAERYQPRPGDRAEVAAWRERMATAEGKATYKVRGALAEWANARLRQMGMVQFTVRGISKVQSVVLLAAVAQNLLRWVALGG